MTFPESEIMVFPSPEMSRFGIEILFNLPVIFELIFIEEAIFESKNLFSARFGENSSISLTAILEFSR